MSSSILDKSLEFYEPEHIIEDDGDSDLETVENRSKPNEPAETNKPQKPSDQLTTALNEIKELYADPVTSSPLRYETPKNFVEPSVYFAEMKELSAEFNSAMEDFDESFDLSLAIGKQTGCAGSMRKDMEPNMAEVGLFEIRRSHIRKAIKELKIANSPMLASLKRQDRGNGDEPKPRKRQHLDSPPERKQSTAVSSNSRKREKLSPHLRQVHQPEPCPALPAAQPEPPTAPPKTPVASKFRAVPWTGLNPSSGEIS